MTARLLDPDSTAAIVLGAYDWREAGLEQAPSFRRSARHIILYLYDPGGLGLDPELVLDLFDDPSSSADQLARAGDWLEAMIRDRKEEGAPITDVLVYYIGHGHPDEAGGLSLLVRRTQKRRETESGIRASDLARILRTAAPNQRRSIILDCCYSESAARAFIGMTSDLNVQTAKAVGHEFESRNPARGSILLASSPVGRPSIGVPSAERTLFTGALLKVLRNGIGSPTNYISFFDLKEAVYDEMLSSFGSKAPRPALHQTNQEFGDLTRLPAFVNRHEANTRAALTAELGRQKEEARRLAEEGQRNQEKLRKAEKDRQIEDDRQAAEEDQRRAIGKMESKGEAATNEKTKSEQMWIKTEQFLSSLRGGSGIDLFSKSSFKEAEKMYITAKGDYYDSGSLGNRNQGLNRSKKKISYITIIGFFLPILLAIYLIVNQR